MSSPSRPSSQTRTRAGLSLLEVVVTVIILAITAGAMIGPSFRAIADSRRAGAEEEIYQQLLSARSRAIATGLPQGVQFSTSPSPTVTPLAISGASVITRVDPLNPVPPASFYQLQSRYPGITINIGSFTTSTIWFGIDGTPETRGSNGLRTGTAASDSTIVVTGGSSIVVRAVSGLVEKQP